MLRKGAILAVIIAGVLGVLYFANDYLFSSDEEPSLCKEPIVVVALDVQADDVIKRVTLANVLIADQKVYGDNPFCGGLSSRIIVLQHWVSEFIWN